MPHEEDERRTRSPKPWLDSARRPVLLMSLAAALAILIRDNETGLVLLALGYAASWLPTGIKQLLRARDRDSR